MMERRTSLKCPFNELKLVFFINEKYNQNKKLNLKLKLQFRTAKDEDYTVLNGLGAVLIKSNALDTNRYFNEAEIIVSSMKL